MSKTKRTTANERACYTCKFWSGGFLDWGECEKHPNEQAYSYGTCIAYKRRADR